MYVCGVTVYDYCHLGHARAYVAFDIIRRHLEYRGYTVQHVQNFTDIDDKIIERAQKNNEDVATLTARFEKAYSDDMQALNILPAHGYPKATASMPAIIAMIENLIARGHAYAAGGDVFFSISSDDRYGQLSKRGRKQMEAGARIDVDTRKKDPLDFVLWKAQKPGEPAWESPWGLGRPGWHIECSAMATTELGSQIDIHGGGRDLIFPHHENEIAQSECSTGLHPFVKYWLHNGFVTIDKQKMSKSLGNFFTLRDLLEKYAPMTLRFFLLTTHYRHPINFSDQLLSETDGALLKLRQTAHSHPSAAPAILETEFTTRFDAAMDDDFNTAEAIACLFDLSREVNKAQAGGALLKHLAERIGVTLHAPEVLTLDDTVEKLVAERQAARASKNFALADEIRKQLTDMGIALEDTPQGLRWKKVS